MYILFMAFNLLLSIFFTSLASADADVYAYLRDHETRDEIYKEALRIVRQQLPGIVQSIRTDFPPIDIFVVKASDDIPTSVQPFLRQTCTASPKGLPPAIICNEDYLVESEIAVLRLEQKGSDVLKTDMIMFGFVAQANSSPHLYLQKLRRHAKNLGAPTQKHVIEHISLALLFYASHELGHLLTGTEGRTYDMDVSSVQDASEANDSRAELAREKVRTTIKMCRHVNEFVRAGFDLPGWGKAAGYSKDAREAADLFKSEYMSYVQRESPFLVKRFEDEDAADMIAVSAVANFLKAREEVARPEAENMEYLLMETLYAVAIFDWYKHLLEFGLTACRRFGTEGGLSWCLEKDPGLALRAEKAFGREHRFLMLRAYKAIEFILLRTFPPEERVPGITEQEVEALYKEKDPDKQWLKLKRIQRGDIGQRYLHLFVLMDNPVKLAYLACANDRVTARHAELQAAGKGYEMRMQFESLEEASKRHMDVVEKIRRGEPIGNGLPSGIF